MITYKALDIETRENMHDMLIGLCLDGQCYAFAIAMHRCLGWPMVGLMQGLVIRHAAVIDPDGSLWDCRGKMNKEDFGKPYGIKFPYELKTITEAELNVTNPISEPFIASLSRMVQSVWPELPWRSNTLIMRVRVFAEELEALSRKHNLWIYGNFPATLPAIAEGDEDEKGYALSGTITGGYMISRTFESEK